MKDSLEIKPHIEAAADCTSCGTRLAPQGLLWQGIHVCAEYRCTRCRAGFHEDLPVGHAIQAPFRVDHVEGERRLTGGDPGAVSWFGEPLRRSLEQPDPAPVAMEVRSLRKCDKVVVLNCLDFLYGHCLLKLLNAARHLKAPEWGLVVIVPGFLAWMVPDGVAEVWTVDLPPGRAQRHFPDLHRRISAELERFAQVRLSRAYSHPRGWEPLPFTRVPRHDYAAANYRVTFVWRSDRLWQGDWSLQAAIGNAGFTAGFLQALQRRKVVRVLEQLRGDLPEAKLTVAGIGREGGFPPWIDDRRLARPGDPDGERELCRTYAESRVVIGVHGSNMLLASGHAGMSIDLMPESRWTNIAQDVLFAGEGVPDVADGADAADRDPRLSAFRHRFLPIGTAPSLVAQIAAGMVRKHDHVARRFVTEQS